MIVVADASPIIFLAKIRRLDLIQRLLGEDIRIPRTVVKELVVPGMDPVEEEVITHFLATTKVEQVRKPRRFATAMSAADNAALTLALRSKADFLLCDERVTRSMAEIEGIRPLGTLGILLRATRDEIITKKEARRLVDTLVSEHNLRIGVEVYQAILKSL
ncbi:MAG: DUF3368 domain-containing protein [Verrucomicrobia bacterium]|jgi:predicted nucleic acid-binding protein|nr:DUF3368 domain-containing protein [Verrucomicrobiota bacterium]